MNRRELLTLTTGFVLGSALPENVQAQKTDENFIPWFINEEELNTPIVLPKVKKPKGKITTNRFDREYSEYESIIKKAESVYTVLFWNHTKENEKPIWYLSENSKIPYNVTPRAVNYFFELASKTKKSDVQYIIDVSELWAIKGTKTIDKTGTTLTDQSEEVYEVSLKLRWNFVCGFLCGGGFERRKKVFFNKKEEITALYMPELSEWDY